MRIVDHPVLGKEENVPEVTIYFNGRPLAAQEGEPVAAALMAHGIRVFRRTRKRREVRGVFCAIGRCTDCAMTVDGVPGVRTCITPVRDGITVESDAGGEGEHP